MDASARSGGSERPQCQEGAEAGSSPTSGHNPGERQPGVEDLSAFLDATIIYM